MAERITGDDVMIFDVALENHFAFIDGYIAYKNKIRDLYKKHNGLEQGVGGLDMVYVKVTPVVQKDILEKYEEMGIELVQEKVSELEVKLGLKEGLCISFNEFLKTYFPNVPLAERLQLKEIAMQKGAFIAKTTEKPDRLLAEKAAEIIDAYRGITAGNIISSDEGRDSIEIPEQAAGQTGDYVQGNLALQALGRLFAENGVKSEISLCAFAMQCQSAGIYFNARTMISWSKLENSAMQYIALKKGHSFK
jgi:hypothetical protein